MRLTRIALILGLMCVSFAGTGSAATLRVCASGCDYAALQPAIDAAVAGDTILLRAGETFVGPFILRAKPASTGWITIRSDAADALLPADGVRLVPSGRTGSNTPRSLLPRLLGQSGALKTTPVVRTAAGAHHYRLQFLEIDGSANLGFETLIALGDDTTAAPAHDIVIDRVYAHGHQYKGMKRGISLNSERTDILNSYVSDIKAVNADSQAIAGYNGKGPFRIINNYLEGAGENVIFGGSDPAVTGLVPTGIEVRKNHLYKPLAWQNAILAAPGSARASAAGAGSLAAGTHYFKVVALMDTDTRTAVSVASNEAPVAVAAGQAATVAWSAVAGADRYRVYRGAAAGAESVYLETASAVTSFTYTGKSELAGKPAASGTQWTVKNIFELKNAEQVIVDGNVMENIWQAGQYGYALVLTPRNQDGTAPWVHIRDVVISNNLVRHAAGVLQLSGTDATHPSERTERITLRNNLFYDIDPKKWGGSAKVFLIGEGPAGVILDHNTIISTNSSVVYAYGTETVTGFVYTNNISQHDAYGIMGQGGRPGQYTIDMFFPASVITNNVLAGGSASLYPVPNAFPTVAQWTASFVGTGDDYRLLPTSVFYAAGAGGSIPGADFGPLATALLGSGATGLPAPPTTEPPASEPPPPPPPSGNAAPVARPGGPYVGAVKAAITVDGSGSSDADGAIAHYRWTWGDEILVNAADVAPADIVGTRWTRVQSAGAADGWALHNPDKAEAKRTAAAAAPSSYVDVRFYAAAGVPYHLWFRMKAQADSYNNDSMFVQFSGAVTSQGAALNRIGTTSAGVVFLEEGNGAGVSGWGWNDESYGALAAPVYFATSGLQTIRVQQREDGIMWDQLLLSSTRYLATRPGLTRVDTSIAASTDGNAMVTSHAYAVAGQYPLVLLVTDNSGADAAAFTTVTVGGAATASIAARAGGPYAGTVAHPVTFDGTLSSVPSTVAATYAWTFGDDIVLDTAAMRATGTGWRTVADATAATGKAMENPNLSQPKIATAPAAPASYVEASFRAAAGVPYRLWVRMRAIGDSYSNDSVYVQFSGTVTAAGAAATRIGSTDALSVILEEGSGAGVHGWGWGDAGYGSLAAPIYFNQDGEQTIRIQQREDGIQIDQIVISADSYAAASPGGAKDDTTIVPPFPVAALGPVVSHTYRTAGTYPVTLLVDGGTAGTGTNATVAVIK